MSSKGIFCCFLFYLEFFFPCCLGLRHQIACPSKWDVLGPFPVGMREVDALSLNAFGSIFAIPRGDNNTYPSELGVNGRISWTVVFTGPDNSVQISYPYWNLSFLQPPYGWQILLWQGWALGDFVTPRTSWYLIQCLNVMEFYVDKEQNYYHGDWLNYRTSYVPIYLLEGRHTLFVKVMSSVRAYGNTPNVSFSCNIYLVQTEGLVVLGSTVPAIVNNQLSGTSASITVVNVSPHWIRGVRVRKVQEDSGSNIPLDVTPDPPVDIASGQIVPINFELTLRPTKRFFLCFPFRMDLCIIAEERCINYSLTIGCANWTKGYNFTFRDYDGSVQYGALLPPKRMCSQFKNSSESRVGKCAILLALHGAGVDAASSFWTEAFNRQDYAWVLLPTGRRPWGYDWHGPSLLNVWSAVRYLSNYLPGVPSNNKMNYLVDTQQILYAGHSMGGCGTWMITTHFPDLALASAPAAGFIAIEYYVPYTLRVGYAHMDKILTAILESSIAEFDSNLYISNAVGIPFLVQWGSLDDNVPPWNSRRLVRMLDEFSGSKDIVQGVEVFGAGHWWNGVMNGPLIQQFFDTHINKGSLPPFPRYFTVTTINPSSSGPRGSVQILQNSIPFRLARIEVTQETSTQWRLVVHNVKRFGLTEDPRGLIGPNATILIVDEQNASSFTVSSNKLPKKHFCKVANSWKVCTAEDWLQSGERTLNQNGPAARIFEKRFVVCYGTLDTDSEEENGRITRSSDERLRVAVQIANDWFIYSSGNATILSDNQLTVEDLNYLDLNVIFLGGPTENKLVSKLQNNLPVVFNGTRFVVGGREYSSPGIGALFLAPLVVSHNLALIVCGTDSTGFKLASRYVPYISGMTIPDYYVVGPTSLWQGVPLAAGFWDHSWRYNAATGYVT